MKITRKQKLTKKQRLTRKQRLIKKDKLIRNHTYSIKVGGSSIKPTTIQPPYKIPQNRNKSKYSTYDVSNQSIGIKVNETDDDFVYYSITPLRLSVPTLQHAVEKESLSIIEEGSNYYLGFKDIPSLLVSPTYAKAYTSRPVEAKHKITKKKTTSNSNNNNNKHFPFGKIEAQWFNVTEDEETYNKDNTFEIIEKYKANKSNTDDKFIAYRKGLTINNQLKPNYLPKSNGSSTHPHLNNLINAKYKKGENAIYISTATNLETFEYLIEKVRAIIKQIQQIEDENKKEIKNENETETEKKKERLKELFYKRKLGISKVTYRAYIKLDNYIKNSSNKYNPTYLNTVENIRWVVANALWLEEYLKLNTNYMTSKKKEDRLKADTLFDKIGEAYECDLSGLDEKYLIVDDTTHPEYVICGYPEKEMKAHILNFWQDKPETNTLNTGFKETNVQYIVDLFNQLQEKKKEEEIKKLNEKKEEEEIQEIEKKIEEAVIKFENNKINDDTKYYKLYMNLRKGIFDYIKNRYEEIYKNTPNNEEYTNFTANFKKNAEAYFQKIAEKYLPKPMLFIKYVFLIFKKQPDGKLIPMVFNVKEITPENKPILERVEKLIKHELPYRFGILSDDEYNNREGNEKDSFDDEYKLWYSRYRYGKFFHISTEYVHTMSNISDKAHGYKNSITLEELIYACGLNSYSKKPFLEDLKIEYEIREHQINNYGMVQEQIKQNTESKKNENSVKNRSDIVFDLYEKDKAKKIEEEHKFEVVLRNKELYKTLNNKDIKFIKFILMFKSSVQQYTLIYKYNDEFYKLVIESNIKSIIDEIITELNTMVLSNNSTTIKFKNPTKLFKIVSNTILDIEDYKLIFYENPFILSNIKKIPNTIELDLSYYYEISLLKSKPLGICKNLYTETKPYRYTNHIIGKQYIEGFKKYIANNKRNLECNTLTFEEKFTECVMRTCNPSEVIINCAYYNIGGSGYDIIESIDNASHKIILYIVPHNSNYDEKFITYPIHPTYTQKYLGSYLDLEGSSLSILKEIKKKYSSDEYICFLHHTKSLRFYCLHFHIIKKNNYKRNYPNKEMGSYMIQDMFIDELINNLNNNINYYNYINYNLFKST
jgi:hypothetical protein